MTELLFSCELSLTDWGVGSSYRSQSDSTKLLLNKYSRAEGVFNIQGKKCSELGNRLMGEICEYEPHTQYGRPFTELIVQTITVSLSSSQKHCASHSIRTRPDYRAV